ncbi:MAG TPA: DinB family protein, partial [Puia sp.]|nr:DinB family protein [Puia sp.]
MPLSASALTRLRYQHQTIRELIGSLPEHQLRQRINPDKWSAFENIAHLACYQPVFHYRLERIQQDNAPSFSRYVAEADPAFPGYTQQQLGRLLGGIDAD